MVIGEDLFGFGVVVVRVGFFEGLVERGFFDELRLVNRRVGVLGVDCVFEGLGRNLGVDFLFHSFVERVGYDRVVMARELHFFLFLMFLFGFYFLNNAFYIFWLNFFFNERFFYVFKRFFLLNLFFFLYFKLL